MIRCIRQLQALLLFFFCLTTLILEAVEFGGDGSCSLYGFVPFTAFDNYAFREGSANDGFMHMTAAVMAVEHFNNRDNSVVSNLPELLSGCDVTFTDLRFFDTGKSHDAVEALWEAVQKDGSIPCLAVGPFNDLSALELSSVANAVGFPLMLNRANNFQSTRRKTARYTTQIQPITAEMLRATLSLVLELGRTNYIVYVYPLTQFRIAWSESMRVGFDAEGVTGTFIPFDPITPRGVSEVLATGPEQQPAMSYKATMKAIKATGYRTIFLTVSNPKDEIPALALAAKEADLTNGDYLWVIAGDLDTSFKNDLNSIEYDLLGGSVWLLPSEQVWSETDPFVKAKRNMDPTTVERLNALNPIQMDGKVQSFEQFGYSMNSETGYVLAHEDFLTKSGGSFGSGFMYDAVMAAGIGACGAWNEAGASRGDNKNGTVQVSAKAVVEKIRSTKFTGTSGNVMFGLESHVRGVRRPGTTQFDVWNILPRSVLQNGTFESPFQQVYSVSWPKLQPTIKLRELHFADGRSVPPELLRDVPEQNFKSTGLLVLAWVLGGVAMTMCVASALWIGFNRKHKVLRASQPFFLYGICGGAFVLSCSIFMISVDEGIGLSQSQLDLCCMALPWLLAFGHILTYGALSAKLWRIDKVLNMTRRKVGVVTALWPSIFLLLAALMLLSVWTGLSPMLWNRFEINSETGESYGSCSSEKIVEFASPLLVVMLVPTLLTGYMSYKTRDIDDKYSESKWIFIMVLVQFEALLFYTPLIVVIKDLAPAVQYIGFILVIITFPLSTILLLIGPKVFAFLQKETMVTNRRNSSTHFNLNSSSHFNLNSSSQFNLNSSSHFGTSTRNIVTPTTGRGGRKTSHVFPAQRERLSTEWKAPVSSSVSTDRQPSIMRLNKSLNGSHNEHSTADSRRTPLPRR